MCGRYVSPDEAAMERAWHVVVRRRERTPAAVVARTVRGIERDLHAGDEVRTYKSIADDPSTRPFAEWREEKRTVIGEPKPKCAFIRLR